MKCTQCSFELSEASKFCPGCGCPVDKQAVDNAPPVDSGSPAQPFDNPAQPFNNPENPLTDFTNQQKKDGKKKRLVIIGAIIGGIVLLLILIGAIGNSAKTKADVVVDVYEAIEKEEGTFDFEFSDKSKNFIREHPEYFEDDDFLELIAASKCVRYAELKKNVSIYQTTVVAIYGGYVCDIEEYEVEDGTYVTYIHILDDDNGYYIGYYLGRISHIYTGDTVDAYVIPLDTTYFDNIGGGTTRAVMSAICLCEESIF